MVTRLKHAGYSFPKTSSEGSLVQIGGPQPRILHDAGYFLDWPYFV